jgi:hypothetical protein
MAWAPSIDASKEVWALAATGIASMARIANSLVILESPELIGPE